MCTESRSPRQEQPSPQYAGVGGRLRDWHCKWPRLLVFVLIVARAAGAQALPQLGSEISGEEREAQEEVVLAVGEQTVLSAQNVRSYSEATRGIVDVRLTRDAKTFVLVGLKPGKTTLLFLMLDGAERLVEIEVKGTGAQRPSQPDKEVGLEHNVRLDFYFIQLIRNDSMKLGIGTPESVTMGTFSSSFDFLTQSFQSATALVENQALLRLDMAQSSGWARLKRKAAVITENGQTATFSGGGEVNIPVQGSLTTGIHRISFGSKIEVLPRYDVESGRLEIALAADVSDLTDDRGSGVPGRVVSSLQTVVNLELGQAVVLAGLTAESELQSKSGIPGLSQIPLLGHLFGTRNTVKQEADTVILIVPSVVDATTTDGRRKIKEAFSAYREFRGRPSQRRRLGETWSDPGVTGEVTEAGSAGGVAGQSLEVARGVPAGGSAAPGTGERDPPDAESRGFKEEGRAP